MPEIKKKVCECISGNTFFAGYFDMLEIKINSELVKEYIIINHREMGYLTPYK